MNISINASQRSARPYMTLEELVDASPIPATEEMPAEIANAMTTDSGVYVRSTAKPKG